MNTLTKLQLEGLEEIGNIGGCKTATILSYLCEEKLIPDLPEIQVVNLLQLKELWEESEDLMICSSLNLMGEIIGKFSIIFSSEIGLYLANKVIKDRFSDSSKLIEIGMLELKKINEMISNTYFDAISNLLNISLIPYHSEINIGDFETCIKKVGFRGAISQSNQTEAISDDVLLIHSTFSRLPFLKLWGSFFFVFDYATIKAILQGLWIIGKRLSE